MADWDSFAERYDDIFPESRLYSDTLDLMSDMALRSGGSSFLDLGCGTGNVSARLLSSLPCAAVMGVDPSAGMRDVCARRFAGTDRYRVADGSAVSIPAPDAAFDGVLSNLALHHVPPGERGKCAWELARVIRPDGFLVYADIFSGVDESDVTAWTRDMIEKHLAMALYCLEHGAYDMMMLLMEVLPKTLRREGEYLTTAENWMRELEAAGFVGLSVLPVQPEECGTAIIRGTSRGQAP